MTYPTRAVRAVQAACALTAVIALGACGAPAQSAAVSAPAASAEPAVAAPASPTPSASETPSASASPSVAMDGQVPVVSPSLTPIDFNGIGGTGVNRALTAEETQARDTIYRTLPVLLNSASHKYSSPAGARDELLSQGLITQAMADGYFPQEFSRFQEALNKVGYVVQTTAMQCAMTTTMGTTSVLESGQVACYYSRHYVDSKGIPVTAYRWNAEVGGAGAIDPKQEQRSVFYMKKDGGTWKVDRVQIQAY